MFSLTDANQFEQAYLKKVPMMEEPLRELAQVREQAIFTTDYEVAFEKVFQTCEHIDDSNEARSVIYFKLLYLAFTHDNILYLRKAMDYFNQANSSHAELGWSLLLSFTHGNKCPNFIHLFMIHTMGQHGDYYRQFSYQHYKKEIRELIFQKITVDYLAQNSLANLFQQDKHIYRLKDLPLLLTLQNNQFHNFAWFQRVINKKNFPTPAKEFTYTVIEKALQGCEKDSKNIVFLNKLFTFYQDNLDYARIYDMIESCNNAAKKVIQTSGLDINLLEEKLKNTLDLKHAQRKMKI